MPCLYKDNVISIVITIFLFRFAFGSTIDQKIIVLNYTPNAVKFDKFPMHLKIFFSNKDNKKKTIENSTCGCYVTSNTVRYWDSNFRRILEIIIKKKIIFKINVVNNYFVKFGIFLLVLTN